RAVLMHVLRPPDEPAPPVTGHSTAYAPLPIRRPTALHILNSAGGISEASVTDQRRRTIILRSGGVVPFGSVHSTPRITLSSLTITRLPSARLSSCSPVTRLWRTLPGIFLTGPLDGRKTILSCHRTTV